ncbi:MAG: DUF4142 domain-containing protein [Candidatus Eremiobacteraeota bacterium]|nr:DUF4142 domain-containing protein [Candidatus Eremiobacteraeota bacterium]
MQLFRLGFLGALVAVAVGMTGSVALAQKDDKAFVYSLLQEAKGQIRFAQLAQERAQSDSTHLLADRVLREWQTVQTRLGEIAFEEAYPTPGAMNDEQSRTLDRLGHTQPEDFDMAYRQTIYNAYRHALAMLHDEESTSDQNLNGFVGRTVPMFEQTRDMSNAPIPDTGSSR